MVSDNSSFLVLNTAIAPNFCGLICHDKMDIVERATPEVSLSAQGMDLIIRTLAKAALSLDSLSGIVFVAGPGSFTGIRTGLAMLKGLAFGRTLPAVALSSLRLNARPFFGKGRKVCPVMDAKMNQVYTALFNESGEQLEPDQAEYPDVFSGRLSGDILFVGEDAGSFSSSLESGRIFSVEYTVPTEEQIVAAVLEEALTKFERNETVPISTVSPFYLRQSYAEIKSASKAS